MKQIIGFALCAFLFWTCTNEKPAEEMTDTAAGEAQTAPAEFGDPQLAEVGKRGLTALASGDIDGWMNDFADNAVYVWNSGDSLAGKPAIAEYWKKRMTEVIESLEFSNQVWLPIIINQPQGVEQAGTWLLGWYQTTAKYKTGKSMTQWIHTDYHFDADGKIDRVIQYLDRVPINAAATK